MLGEMRDKELGLHESIDKLNAEMHEVRTQLGVVNETLKHLVRAIESNTEAVSSTLAFVKVHDERIGALEKAG